MNDTPPVIGEVPQDARPLETEEQLLEAIADMDKLMEATTALFHHYEREVYRRMPQGVCIANGITEDLDHLRLSWMHTKYTRDQLIVRLHYLTRGRGREGH